MPATGARARMLPSRPLEAPVKRRETVKATETLRKDGDGQYYWSSASVGSRRAERPKWPLCSDGAGVHPDQRFEAMDHSREAGVPTEFNNDGQAVFTSHAHRRKYLKAVNLYDKKAYI
ncbi:MAG: hypothetical protein CL462_10300 [Acidimicrobiaceae bacterium]|nr:hypothetical protein [Acidimicrobiaceae bacterium]